MSRPRATYALLHRGPPTASRPIPSRLPLSPAPREMSGPLVPGRQLSRRGNVGHSDHPADDAPGGVTPIGTVTLPRFSSPSTRRSRSPPRSRQTGHLCHQPGLLRPSCCWRRRPTRPPIPILPGPTHWRRPAPQTGVMVHSAPAAPSTGNTFPDRRGELPTVPGGSRPSLRAQLNLVGRRRRRTTAWRRSPEPPVRHGEPVHRGRVPSRSPSTAHAAGSASCLPGRMCTSSSTTAAISTGWARVFAPAANPTSVTLPPKPAPRRRLHDGPWPFVIPLTLPDVTVAATLRGRLRQADTTACRSSSTQSTISLTVN